MSTTSHLAPFQKIEHVAETVGKDVAHLAADIIHVGEDVFKVLSDTKTLAPAFRAELSTLIADTQPIATALAPAIAAGGENVGLDMAAVARVLANLKKLVSDFVAFLPTLRTAVSDDIQVP